MAIDVHRKSYRPTDIAFWTMVATGLSCASSSALAQADWELAIGVGSEYSDNAAKSQTDTLSERRDSAELRLNLDYTNQLLAAAANYQATETRYDKDSQEDRSVVEGSSQLQLGQPRHPIDLLVTHSRRRVLNAPDAVDLLANNDEREILTAAPGLRWRASDVDLLALRGHYSTIDYRFSPGLESERTGGSMFWSRQLSETDQLDMTAQTMDVAFDALPTLDYRFDAYDIGYEVSLRRLQYRLQLGYNETTPEVGGGLSSPSFLVEGLYTSGVHDWQLNAQRFITDSSSGSGNRGDLSEFLPGDATTGEIDQIERTEIELDWSTEAFCQRCDTGVALYTRSDDYRQVDEDGSASGVRINMRYELSRRSSASLTWSLRDQSFESDVAREDFTDQQTRLTYQRRFRNDLEWSATVLYIDRDSDDLSRRYNETVGGMRIGYVF